MTGLPSSDKKPTNMWEELNRPKERAQEPTPEREREDDNAGVPVTGIVGGVVAIAAVVFAGFIVMGGGDAQPSAEASGPETEQVALVDDGATVEEGATPDGNEAAEQPDTTEDAFDGASDSTDADGTDDAGDDAYSPAVPAGAGGNYTVLSRGKLYLRGEIPSPLIEIGAVNALEEIMGEGNVISEYVINPDAPFEMGRPTDVFIEDTVLFRSGSAEIAPDFYPLLGLGVVLLELQDGVTIEVYGHTDSIGSAESNLQLSQARVDAVKGFWVSQGADPERITAIGVGEADPVADNATAQGKQLNRRVEIVITGFVFSL